MTTKKRIIREWNKLIKVHPSLAEVAKRVGVSKSYVKKVVAEHKLKVELMKGRSNVRLRK